LFFLPDILLFLHDRSLETTLFVGKTGLIGVKPQNESFWGGVKKLRQRFLHLRCHFAAKSI